MLTHRQRRFVFGQMMWMLVVIPLLSLTDMFSLELFFLVSFVGFLVLLELTAPVYVEVEWRSRLKWLVLLGVLGFAWIIGGHVLDAISPNIY